MYFYLNVTLYIEHVSILYYIYKYNVYMVTDNGIDRYRLRCPQSLE